MRQRAPIDAVEEAYLESLKIVREQGARSLELRTATTLSRLWIENDRSQAARKLLAQLSS